MRIAMLNDRVLLKLREGKDKTASGLLYIPDTGKDAPQMATVVAVHPGRRTIEGEVYPCIVDLGDTVIFAKYAGSEIEIDGEKYLSLREEDIIAKVADEEVEQLEPWQQQSESSV